VKPSGKKTYDGCGEKKLWGKSKEVEVPVQLITYQLITYHIMFFAKQGKDNKPTYLLAKQRSKVQKKTDGLMKSKVQGCQTMFDGSIQKWTARLSIPPQWLCRGKTPGSAVHSRPQDPRLSCASPGIKYIIRHFMPSKNLSDKDTTWAIQC